MKFDDILNQYGELGRFQIVLFIGVNFYSILQLMQHSCWNFMAPHQLHWCKIDALQSFSNDQQRYIAIPYDPSDANEDVYDSCKLFDLPWENFSFANFDTWNRTAMTKGISVKECSQWKFDDAYQSTIRSEVRSPILFHSLFIAFVVLFEIKSLTCQAIIAKHSTPHSVFKMSTF